MTPFDADLRVDERGVRRPHASPRRSNGSDGFVVCGTTGEASTLTDDEHLGLIELAVARATGRNLDHRRRGLKRHAPRGLPHRRATDLGADAILSSRRTTTARAGAASSRHFQEVARATDLPIGLYNIPVAHGARHVQRSARRAGADRRHRVRQAGQRRRTSRRCRARAVRRQRRHARAHPRSRRGRRHPRVESHRRRRDAPDGRRAGEARRQIDASLRDVYETLFIGHRTCRVKAALNLLGHHAGGVRLPLRRRRPRGGRR